MSIEEYVPTEAETSSDHWSKSPEYLKEKAAREGKFLNAVNTVPVKDRRTTHEITQASFIVEYVPTEAEKLAKEKPSLKSLAEADDSVFEQLAIDMLEKVEESLKTKKIGGE